MLANDIARLAARFATAAPAEDQPPPCGALPLPVGERLEPGFVYCDAAAHYTYQELTPRGAVVGRCPARDAAATAARVAEERARLACVLDRVESGGTGVGWAGYQTREPTAAKALRVMREFSDARPPKRSVLLAGPVGLGKTRLLLASHFDLLAGGVNSRYVCSSELRDVFFRSKNFDVEVAREAERELASLRQAAVVHLDDLGDVDGDQRFRGQFAEGLKALFDRGRARWCIATNLTVEEAMSHPDVGQKVLSRVLQATDVLRMEGTDHRIDSTRRI